MPRINQKTLILLTFFLILAYFPLFFQLDSYTLRDWDESLYAINAAEMAETGDFIVKYSDQKPDMWNTKPPLIVWVQHIFMRVLGYNELAVRLPSAFAGLALLLVLIFFVRKHLDSELGGFLSAFILLCAPAFAYYHTTRTGDHEAPLALFLTLSLIHLYLYFQEPERYKRHLIILTLSLVAAALTKSVMGLLFLPAMLAYVLYIRKAKTFFTRPSTYLAIGGFLLLVLGYYLARESRNPGYLQAVWENELGGRYSSTLEGHEHPFFYYLNNLVSWRFIPFLFFIPLSFFILLREKSRHIRNFVVLMLLAIVLWWLIISISQTKLAWYDVPLLPLMSMIVGLAFIRIFDGAVSYLQLRTPASRIAFAVLICFGLGFNNYRKIIIENIPKKERSASHKYGYLIKEWEKNPYYGDFDLYFYGKAPSLQFYQVKSRLDAGKNHKRVHHFEDLYAGQKILICQQWAIKDLVKIWKVIEHANGLDCKLLELTEKKGPKDL